MEQVFLHNVKGLKPGQVLPIQLKAINLQNEDGPSVHRSTQASDNVDTHNTYVVHSSREFGYMHACMQASCEWVRACEHGSPVNKHSHIWWSLETAGLSIPPPRRKQSERCLQHRPTLSAHSVPQRKRHTVTAQRQCTFTSIAHLTHMNEWKRAPIRERAKVDAVCAEQHSARITPKP